MAITFKIDNGDVIVNTSSGRPTMIGNDLDENVPFKAKEKVSQDMRRSLSINSIRNGSGAGISELIGIMQQVGFISTKVLLQRQITNMFSSITRLQNLRSNIRPANEIFSAITLFRIIQNNQVRTSFDFRLDVVTDGGGEISQSGTVTG